MKKVFALAASLLFAILSSHAQSQQEGMRALDYEKYEAARTIFRNLVAAQPTNGDNYYYLGQAYVNLLNLDSAEITYREGVRLAPANPVNYAGLGELELMANNKDKAKAQFDKALSFSKTKAGIYTDVHAIAVVATAMVNNEVLKMVEEAQALIKMGYEQDKKNYDLLIAGGDVALEALDGGGAATFYERAIVVDPKNPKAYTKVSVIWLRVRNYESAQNDLNRAFDKDPNYALAWKYQAELYYAQRKFEKAKEAYNKYLANSESSIANQTRFARILFLSKEYDEALEKIAEIQKRDTSSMLLYRFRAFSTYEVIANTNNVEKAREGLNALNKYISKVDPKKLTATDYEYLGKLQSKIPGMDSIAMQNLNKAIEMNPYSVDVYVDMGKLNYKLKRYAESAANYETYLSKARKAQPLDYFSMGKSYYFAKDFQKADSAFMKVNELVPAYPEAYYWRGNSYSSMLNQKELAKENYEKYVSIVTSDTAKYNVRKEPVRANLINSYRAIGYYYIDKDDNARAKEYYKKILEIDPKNEDALKVLADPKK